LTSNKTIANGSKFQGQQLGYNLYINKGEDKSEYGVQTILENEGKSYIHVLNKIVTTFIFPTKLILFAHPPRGNQCEE